MSISEGGSSHSLDFDLNLAPVIDCFTVLIAFILISTAYASIGIFDAGLAAGGESQASGKPPEVQVTVELKADHSAKVRISGKATQEVMVAAQGTDWDFAAVNQHLTEYKGRWSSLAGVVLTADNAVEYKDVIRSMESIRKTIPSILLGGF